MVQGSRRQHPVGPTGRVAPSRRGLKTIAEQGAPGLTIERLTARLNLSKGSFYHHSDGMSGFKTALLTHFEAVHTARFIDAVEQGPSAPPMVKLERLVDMVLGEHGGRDLEVAMRAWALQDSEVRDTQERVDSTRVGYLQSLWWELTGDAEEASQLARLLYVILIGAGHVIPPVAPDALRRLYGLAFQLAGQSKAQG